MKDQNIPTLDPESLLRSMSDISLPREFVKKNVVFAQGDAADSLFYLRRGKVVLTVSSVRGREAVVAILKTGQFFGEACLTGRSTRTATAIVLQDCTLSEVKRSVMMQRLSEDPQFSGAFIAHLLQRNGRIEDDLVDQLVNCSEKRLARLLLLLAGADENGGTQSTVPRMSQETLADMIGTTRPRVSYFLNKFRKLGLIDYGDEILVHSALSSVLH